VYTLLIVAQLANGQIVAPDLHIYPSQNACAGAKMRNDNALLTAQALGAKVLMSQCVPLRENTAEWCRQWPQDCR
jgi:hypothetical protein